jgi:lysophospholipase L1-like esterase
MSYTKHEFKTGDKLYASQLNAMDDQIAKNEEDIGQLKTKAESFDEQIAKNEEATEQNKEDVEQLKTKAESFDEQIAKNEEATEQNKEDVEQLKAKAKSFDNAVLFTEQTLTEEQKAQVRANIGIVEDDEDVTVKNVEYTYDGNSDDDTKLFILNGQNYKAFVKVGDLPDGDLNLVGSHVEVGSSGGWSAYSFDITADMLEKQVAIDEWNTVSATVDGLIQILNTSPSKSVEHSLVLVCTRPGNYGVIIESWHETLYFPEAGIYFADFRAFAQHYVTSLSSSYNTVEVEENPAKYEGNEIQVFSKGVCIGDSITEGIFDYDDTNASIKQYSYPTVLKRMTGIDIVNAGISGATSQSWREASINSNTSNGRWVNNEWVRTTDTSTGSASLDYSGFDFAIIHLGINDTALIDQYGSIDAMVNALKTNIKNIIADVKSARRGIKIFLATIIPYRAMDNVYIYDPLNEKIREIANETEDVYLIDLTAYSECLKGTSYGYGWHLTALGYHKMATEIKSIISFTIKNNLESFKAVQFIGTECNM